MKKQNNHYTVSLPWEIGEGVEVDLTVSFALTSYSPAVMYLANGDPGYPAEGGEIEDIEIRNDKGTPLPEAIVNKLAEDDNFIQALYDLLPEQADDERDYGQDAKDYWEDLRAGEGRE